MENENTITALVVGKSGTGKSEFILSFIDEEQRKKIPASGDGQTTRTSMKYEIDFGEQKRELTFDIELKDKNDFVDERMAVVERYFQDKENEIRFFKDNDLQFICNKKLKKKLIFDTAFFNCKEFDILEDISSEIENLYNDVFSCEFWKDIPDDLFDKEKENDEKNKAAEKFNNNFEEFFGEIYKLCRKCIPLKKQKETIVGGSMPDIKLYFKVVKEKSYSALIKNISIVASGTKLYKDIMEKNKIDKLLLIDTYGLDHATQFDDKQLEMRYKKLLRDEYPEVKSIFYLRNIAAPGSPSDLTSGISMLFKVEPSVVPYVIFTFWDKLENKDDYKNKKAYTEIENIQEDIEMTLCINGVSQSLIDSRIKALLDTRIAYASIIDENKSPDEEKALKEYSEKNIESLIHAIRFKTYLGNKCIPIQLLELEKMGEVLSVDNLFKKRDLHDYPNATKAAIRRRIQKLDGRILGFNSSTRDSVLWTDIIANDLNARFTNVIKNYKWEEYLTQKVDKENYSEVIKAVQEIFLDFSKILYWGATNSVDYLNTSCYGNLIIKSLYDEKKDIIDRVVKYPEYSVGDYLTEIYEFGNIKKETKDKIQEIINKAYREYYIPECRKHNASKIADKITENTTWEEKENILSDYYSQYDKNITEDEKEEFEMLVSDTEIV